MFGILINPQSHKTACSTLSDFICPHDVVSLPEASTAITPDIFGIKVFISAPVKALLNIPTSSIDPVKLLFHVIGGFAVDELEH